METLFPFSFARPIWLLLFAVLPLMWWMERRSMVALPLSRRRWARALRTTIVTCVVLALAGIQIVRISDQLTVIFAVDRSDSVREEFDAVMDDLNIAVESMQKNDRAGLIIFGGEAYVESSPGIAPKFDQIETITDTTHTDIARAIRLGLGLFPDDTQRRLVLVTDGNQNLGEALEEATSAAANGVPIDVITVEREVEEEILVEEVALPPSADKDEPFEVRIVLRSTLDAPAKIRLLKDGQSIGEKDISLSPGKNVFTFTEEETEEGFHTYEVLVESVFDTLNENNSGSAFVRVHGKPRVLLVGRQPDLEYLSLATRGQNWEVEESQVLPRRRAQFEDYDAILMANVPSDYFSSEQLQLLHDYVRDQAGGFIMTGGEDSFGLGFYARTPVEETLPVNMELSSKRHFPSLAMALVIDKSGSMAERSGGREKIMIAAQACVEAVRIMTPRDQLMVVAFDGSPKLVRDLDVIGDNQRAISEDIMSITAGGGTVMYPAFEQAYRSLANTQSQLKHIILLTDGMTQPGPFDILARQCFNAGITVSTVAVGPDADQQLMQTIAGMGGGRFYHAADAYSIPRIFAKETYVVQRAYIKEEPFYPAIHQENQIIKGIEEFPEVKGYIVTEAKDRSEIVLLTHEGDPLLAVWRYGLGKSLAFTSDTKARWLQNWIGWEGFNKFWPQSVRWVLRAQEPSQLYPTMTIEQGRGHILVDAVTDEGQFINFLELRGRVMMPEGSDVPSEDVQLRQTAPGRYEGHFDARHSGAYMLRVYGAEDEGIMPATTGEVISYPPEYRDLEPNMLLLNKIVDKTNGRLNPALTDLFIRETKNAKRRYDLWFWLLMGAVGLFPFDIAVRRIFLDEEQKAAVRAWLARFVPRLPRRGVEMTGHEQTMEALKRTKADVARRRFRGAKAKDEPVTGVESPETPPAAASQAAVAPAAQEKKVWIRKPEEAPPKAGAVQKRAPAPEPEGRDTLSRLRRATAKTKGSGTESRRPADPAPGPAKPAPDKPKPFIAPATRKDAPKKEAGEKSDDLSGLSYTERLLRARQKAREDRDK